MDKLAYELGVLQALKIAGVVGLTKEAQSLQTAKRVVAGGRKLVASGQAAKVPKLLESARAIPESFDVARAARRAGATESTLARTSRVVPTGPGVGSRTELINKRLADLEGRISSAQKLQGTRKWQGMSPEAQSQHITDLQKLENQHKVWTAHYNTTQDAYTRSLKQTRPGYESASPHVTGAYAPAPTQAAPIAAPQTATAPAAASAPSGGRGMGLGATALGVGGAAAGAYAVNRAGAAGSKVYRAPVPQMYGETVLEMP